MPTFVEDEDAFISVKSAATLKTIEGFLLNNTVDVDVDVAGYTTVPVRCEAFRKFMTAA